MSAVEITYCEQVGGTTVLVEWTAGSPGTTYYVWVNGALYATTQNPYAEIAGAQGEQLVVQVFNSASDTGATAVYGRATLNWYEREGAEYYRIEELIDGTWTERDFIAAGLWFNVWVSRWLEDSQSHAFRVVPIAGDVDGEPVPSWRYVVRYPNVPTSTLTYNEDTGNLEIGEDAE